MNALFVSMNRGGRHCLSVVAVVLAVVLVGCDPEDVVRWAPDGKHALVRGADTVHVVDESGALLGKAPGARAWMPDSRRVLIVRRVKPRDWDEYAGLLGPERVQAVKAAAEELRLLIREFKGAWSEFGDSDPVKEWGLRHAILADSYNGDDWGETSAIGPVMALFYLMEKYGTEVAPLRAMLDGANESSAYQPMISELVIRSIIPGEDQEQLLVRSADDIIWCRPAPGGDAVVYVIREPLRPALRIVRVEGGAPIQIDEGAIQASWTPDGNWLVYMKTTAPFARFNDELVLGTLTRRRVYSDERRLMEKLDDAEDLAGVLLGKGTGFRAVCLPDGRILFAGMVVQLPAVGSDFPNRVTLFTLRPGDTPKIEPLLDERAQALLPSRLDRFAVSPDGTSIAIPGDKGEVTLFSLKSGQVTQLQGALSEFEKSDVLANQNGLIRPAPTWRSDTELCYVVPPGHEQATPRRGELILRTMDGQLRPLSKSWPDTLADRFLPRLKQ